MPAVGTLAQHADRACLREVTPTYLSLPQRAGNTHVVHESLDGWIADDCSVGRPFVGL